MRIIVCVLLAAAGMAAAHPQITATKDPAILSADLGLGTSAPASSATAPATGGVSPQATGRQTLGPNFFGPGLNNRMAIPINPLVVQNANKVLSTRTGLRVFVDIDGSAHFTDQFGRETEVIDAFGRDLSELLDFQEQQELLFSNRNKQQQLIQRGRERELELRQKQLELQLLQEFHTNPISFNPVGGAGGTAGIQPGNRFSV
ncbi:uncharacterized protein LOC121873329 [Homarus americanus]|uniref:uncharacterized protein LOC121873329 n=1 Tax=Homarus americanus TaxID=6706 RepID=UPI001C4935BF|nr:uncharacterized protein LOC121873329 [Homarus americanus]